MSQKVNDVDAKEARNEYFREYYRKNRDKIRENQKRYWRRKAEAKQSQASE